MQHRTRTVSGIIGLTALTLGMAAAPAQGHPLDRGHDYVSSTEVDRHFCGDLRVRIHDEYHVNFVLNSHGGGLAYDHQTIHGSTTFTNLTTGKSITQVGNFVQKDLKVTDNGDGTLTVLVLSSGSSKLYGPNGKMLLNDPGQTRVKILIDDAGTPNNPFDDEFADFLGVVKGSTGRNDSEGRDFCVDAHNFTAA
jgi:hypothetical protein